MESWCQEWLLKLNPSKCKVMHIGHRVQIGYYVKEEALTRKLDESTEEKDLGIYLTRLKSNTTVYQSSFKSYISLEDD